VRDDAETAKLSKLAGELQEIENNLPIDAKLRNPKLGAMAPIRVVNQLYCAGDANKTVPGGRVQPPQRRTHHQAGRQQAHADQERPAREVRHGAAANQPHRALCRASRSAVSFRRVLHAHSDARADARPRPARHDSGPGGKPITVRAAFQQSYGAFEEAKADIAGLFALQFLIDKGVLDRGLEASRST
jgi:hypothetical protein